ncbi:MAG: sulfatase-like hydrolase/transferase [bacterium]|nr:sulfatase-like hydrolase/transferase [bacterium]
MPDVASPPSTAARGHASFQLWLLNVLVGTFVGSLWLFDSPDDLSFGLRLYVSLALVSSVAILALLPGALFWTIARFVKPWRVVGLAHSLTGSLFLALLYTDTIIYRLLRYHFNGAVLNVAFTSGSEDAVHLGSHVWITATVVVTILVSGQYAFWRWRVRCMQRRIDRGQPAALILQPRVVCLLFFLPVIGIEKSVYAAADISGDRELLYASRALPLFPKPRLAHILDPESQHQLEVLPERARLAYPLERPRIDPAGPRPNIVVLVIDSWRRDMFTPEFTPNLHRFAHAARVWQDHLAGGNGTRYGLFTMLYGLHGSYWFPFIEARRSPVLIDTLQELDYDVRVFSSASMNFPEFLDTAWVGLDREQVVDSFAGPDGEPLTISYEKDELVADAFAEWIDARERKADERPFFSFVLLDGPHQPYYNPGGPYEPVIEKLDYIELGRTTEGPELAALVERVFNTYKNSVVYTDRIAGRMLDGLAERGLDDETIVVVTGDHGEEFQECGYWGHTSNFSPEQLEVPFVMRGPGITPGVETRPTAHIDLPSTLLELLGADPAGRADYCLGQSLFDPPVERDRVVAGWSEIGLWTDAGIFRIPLEVDAGRLEVYDDRWQLLTDVDDRIDLEQAALGKLARECVRFLRPTE